MKTKNVPYEFKHIQTALIAFIADFGKKIHFVFPEIPVLLENIDDSYILYKKYSDTELQELYSKLPRIILNITEVNAKLENNSSQFLKMNYEYNNIEYNTQFRRISSALTIEIKFICSNYLKALEYWEFLLSILCIDNTLTYQYFGNTYQGSYLLQSTPSIEKPPLSNSSSESKNVILNTTIELNCYPSFINVNTIVKNDGSNGFIIDTDIIDVINNNPNGNPTSVDNEGLINSNINSTQEFNDVGLSNNEEKKLLKNRKRVKTGNNVFDIYSQINDSLELTHRSILKTDILKQEEDENE